MSVPIGDIGLLVTIGVTSIWGVLVARNDRVFYVHVLIVASFVFIVTIRSILFLLVRCSDVTKYLGFFLRVIDCGILS